MFILFLSFVSKKLKRKKAKRKNDGERCTMLEKNHKSPQANPNHNHAVFMLLVLSTNESGKQRRIRFQVQKKMSNKNTPTVAVYSFIVLVLAIVSPSSAAAAVSPQQLEQPPIMGILISPYITYNHSLYCISSVNAPIEPSGDARGDGGEGIPKEWLPRGAVRVESNSSSSSSSSAGCVWSVYVQWLQMSGIRVLPIPWDANRTYMTYLLDRINGVLLPGGVLLGHPVIAAYFETVQFIVDRARYYNEVQGDDFVLYGTCQGFELLFSAAAGTMDILSDGFVGTDPKMLPVTFLENQTVLFERFPPSLLDAMQSAPLTLNLHTKGVEPSSLALYPNVSQMLTPTSLSKDLRGVAFIASAESPPPLRIFATQFHPERPCFDFDSDAIGHSPDALMVAQLLSLRVKEFVQRSTHRFEDPNEAERLLIDGVPVQNLGWGMEVYYF